MKWRRSKVLLYSALAIAIVALVSLVFDVHTSVYHGKQNAWLTNLRYAKDPTIPLSEGALGACVVLVVASIIEQTLTNRIFNAIVKEDSEEDNWVQALIANAPLAIAHVDAYFTILAINETFMDMTGFTETEILGIKMLELVLWLGASIDHGSDIESALSSSIPVRNREMSFIHRATGSGRIVLVSIIPTTTNRVGYAVFMEDITTRKQWEAYSARNDRLNLIAEFAASTAHEIRNPLTTVRGFLQLQKRRLQQPPGKDHFQIMIDEIDRVDGLITEYLTLARNSVTAQRSPTQMNELLSNMLPLVTAEANLKGVFVSVGIIPEGICHVCPQEIKQVFLNLTKNALDAMDKGGTLTINAHRESTTYTLSVSDTGTGITKSNLERIFDPFFTTKLSGSGLGLAVSIKIIEAHHGKIHVESEPGEGTTFNVIFPLIDIQVT